jgi:hypothetical protein
MFPDTPMELEVPVFGLALTLYICSDGTITVFDGFNRNGLDSRQAVECKGVRTGFLLLNKIAKTTDGFMAVLEPDTFDPSWTLVQDAIGRRFRVPAESTPILKLTPEPQLFSHNHTK